MEEAGPINPYPRVAGPSKTWFLQYVFIAYLNLIVTIHILHCQLKPLILIVYAVCPVGCGCRRVQCDQIAGGVPPYSWGEAVLAVTYRGLCDGCRKTHGNAILAGCPLLLQFWSYERLAVGRPIVSYKHYHESMYGDEEDVPTMGTLWNWRQVRSQQI